MVVDDFTTKKRARIVYKKITCDFYGRDCILQVVINA